MRITVGFKDEFDPQGREVLNINKIEELSNVILKEHYSLGVFKGNYRNRENFLVADSIALDFDEGYSIDQAIKDFAEYSHIIAPSRSHRKEKNGKIEDRFRVILFLSEPITDYDKFKSTWYSLEKSWPKCDPRCKDASRLWFASSETVSIKKGGKRVVPVEPPPATKTELSSLASEIVPGIKGKLSKNTEKFLKEGVQSGGRNDATMRAAKDFQQNLYSVQEAIDVIVPALHASGTIASDFTEQEVITTIRSSYNTEAKHDPRMSPPAFKLRRIGELYRDTKDAKIEWVLKDLLQVGGTSLLSADPKAGKSVIARQICTHVLSGTPFFGRETRKGAVHYYGIEEDEKTIAASFKRLGVPEDAELYVHSGDPITDSDIFKSFSEMIIATKPVLAVIDTAFDLLEVESENNYTQVKKAFRKVRKVARQSGTHIILIHHNGKPQKDYRRRGNHSPLGSTGITAGVDSIMIINMDGSTRVIYTSGRDVDPWDGYKLIWDKATKTYSIGPKYEEPDEY